MDHFGNGIKKRLGVSNNTNTMLDMKIGMCAASMLEAANAFHFLHLKIKGQGGYAAHIALNELYEALPDLVDTVIEGYQGAAEVLLDFPQVESIRFESVEDAVNFIRMKCENISMIQEMMPYSEVSSNMDLIKDALNKAKYKLIFLK